MTREQELVEDYVEMFVDGKVSLLDLDWTLSHKEHIQREAARKALVSIEHLSKVASR